jgi:hypothetical protein
MFEGRHETLLSNGRERKATIETDYRGRVLSTLRVPIGAADTITVEVPS